MSDPLLSFCEKKAARNMARTMDVSLLRNNTPFYVPALFVDTTKNKKKLPIEVLFFEDSPLLHTNVG